MKAGMGLGIQMDLLKGYEIPFGTRVIAVADSYNAMISDRPYRVILSSEQAILIPLARRGKQWNANIDNAFFDLIYQQQDEKPHVVGVEQIIPRGMSQVFSVASS